MSTGVIWDFSPVGWSFCSGKVKGTYRGGTKQLQAHGHGIFTGEKEYAGWRFEGEWVNNCMRHGVMEMGRPYHDKWYVGEFGEDGSFCGRGEFWLGGSVHLFDSVWEEGGWARYGMAEESDGSVYRVTFEGRRGAFWGDMERVFAEKQNYRNEIGSTSASWVRLPVRVPPSTMRALRR
jgi:hypothetical protein